MPDAIWIAIAAVATFAALCSITLGVWLTARAAWRERRAKRAGYIDFNPTRPQRRRPRRGQHRPGS